MNTVKMSGRCGNCGIEQEPIKIALSLGKSWMVCGCCGEEFELRPVRTTMSDAIRSVVAVVQKELESGGRSARMDAHDVVDLLLAIADKMEGAEHG